MRFRDTVDISATYFSGVGHLTEYNSEYGIARIRIYGYFYILLSERSSYAPRISVATTDAGNTAVFFGKDPLPCENEEELREMCERISQWCLMLLQPTVREEMDRRRTGPRLQSNRLDLLGPGREFVLESLVRNEPLVYQLSERFASAIEFQHISKSVLYRRHIEPYLFAIAHGPIQFTIDPRLAGEDSLAGKQWKILQDHYGYVLDPETLIAVER